jgi:hypothetical protein
MSIMAVPSPRVSHARFAAWGERLSKWFARLLAKVILFVMSVVVTGIVFAHLTEQKAADDHELLIVGIICAMPALLGLFAAYLVRNALGPQYLARDRTHTPTRPVVVPPQHEAMYQEAQRTLSLEALRIQGMLVQADVHALLWGSLTTMGLALCALAWFGPHPQLMAKAVAVGLVVCFLVHFARIILRSAKHDATTTMFAHASSDLLFSVIASLAGQRFLQLPNDAGPLIAGLAGGLLGPLAIAPIREKLVRGTGIAVREAKGATQLTAIDGIDSEDADRLAEEGILTLHSLAFTNSARIFFSTPYDWSRICDWQTKAVLMVRLGAHLYDKVKQGIPHADALGRLNGAHSDSDDDHRNLFGAEVPEAVVRPLMRELRLIDAYRLYGDALVVDAFREPRSGSRNAGASDVGDRPPPPSIRLSAQ